ncbi:C40 family peptidase [Angustibacter aerolatus]|uniref:Hydrolase n=1 Tax=Angustibacter aerolatus TaxID=1162965 RepID=A0ABQ6JDU1_9ACTN|nr:C40 family peptidase [Angustibacter aerolatus]GMA86351.1 hydrolase [Angustibacter aerolatus]
MTTRAQGRHRAPARTASTTSHTLAHVTGQVTQAVSGNAGTVAKTGAVLAVSSGLIASFGLQAASAAPHAPEADPTTSSVPAVGTVEASGVPAAVVDGVSAAPSFGELGFTAKVKPKPKKKKVVEVVRQAVRASSSASSSSERGSSRSSRSSERSSVGAPVHVKAGAPGSAVFGAAVMQIAARYAGIAYRYGGTTPAGFDCSGYTGYVMRQVGISLPRTSSAQRAATRRISRSEAVPGDLVFMPGHVGIYAGNGMMWDSPHTGASISKRAIYSSSATFGRVG